MKVGVFYFPTDYGIDIAELAQALEARGLPPVLAREVQTGKPFLGVCLGMQLLADKGFEHGVHNGLRLIAGDVVRLEAGLDQVKIPHTGWNTIALTAPHPLFRGFIGASVKHQEA